MLEEKERRRRKREKKNETEAFKVDLVEMVYGLADWFGNLIAAAYPTNFWFVRSLIRIQKR